MKISRNLIIGGIVIGVLAVFAIVITVNLSSSIPKVAEVKDKVVVVDPVTGEKITFGRDGLVIIEDANGNVRTEVWDTAKIEAFWEYINSSYGTSESYSINFEDDEVIEEIVTGGGGDDDDGDIGQFFATPTPPAGGGGGGSSGGGNGGSGSGGGGAGGAPSWCKYWKLSYCADPVPQASSSPVPSYPPGVIVAEDCDDWNTQSEFKTVISNSSCSQFSPSPTPNPEL